MGTVACLAFEEEEVETPRQLSSGAALRKKARQESENTLPQELPVGWTASVLSTTKSMDVPGVSSRQLSALAATSRQTSSLSDRWATALDRPSDFHRAAVELSMDFPMWLMPAQVFVDLEAPLLPHDQLVQNGKLVRWEEGRRRKVVLISHQWAGKRHPDPKMEQMKVLQELLREMALGHVEVTTDTLAQLGGSDPRLPSREEQRKCLDWDIWYDFFGIPQVDDRGCVASIPELQAAVDSIPAYCDIADYVFILAPTMKHADTGALMNYATWGTRGWCRVERTATVLSAKEKPLLVVSGPATIFASSGAEWIQNWPHHGNFTVEEDRATVMTLLKQLLSLKCARMLQLGDVNRWRFYKALSVKILQTQEPRSAKRSELLDAFQVSYQFPNLSHHRGLTPLMLACVESSRETVDLLLEEKVDVNICWRGGIPEVQLARWSALDLAAAMSTREVVCSLLRAKAILGNSSLLCIAALFGNHEVLPVFTDAGLKLEQSNLRGDSPLICAMLTQNPRVVETLLRLRADANERSSSGITALTMCVLQGLEQHTAHLLDARADANAFQASGSVKAKLSLKSLALGRSSHMETVLPGTALHVATMQGHWPLVSLLLRYRADPLAAQDGPTALELAEEGDHSLLMRLTAASRVDYFAT